MATTFCRHCGGANLPETGYCQNCGNPMATVPSGPLPSDDSPGSTPASEASPSYVGPARPPPRRRSWLTIGVVIVVVILLLGAVVFVFLPTSSSAAVTVTSIHFSSPDNACGVDGLTTNGFNASTGESLGLGLYMYGNSTPGGSAACAVHSLSTITPGFSITGANVPLSIPANTTRTLSFTVNMPGSAYTGILTLVVT